MSSIYLYFNDFTELVLALLEPVEAEAEEAFLGQLRDYWSDQELHGRCLDLVTDFHAFWVRHARLLHLRNAISDQRDIRIMHQRISLARPIIDLLIRQMGRDPGARGTPAVAMATTLYTGLERVFTVETDEAMRSVFTDAFQPDVENALKAEARLLELGIRDYR